MSDLRKITAFIPERLLASAQDYTGAGVTETLRIALERLNHQAFCEGLRELRGQVKFDYDLDELREDRDLEAFGKKP